MIQTPYTSNASATVRPAPNACTVRVILDVDADLGDVVYVMAREASLPGVFVPRAEIGAIVACHASRPSYLDAKLSRVFAAIGEALAAAEAAS